jgi:hypothetical protein
MDVSIPYRCHVSNVSALCMFMHVCLYSIYTCICLVMVVMTALSIIEPLALVCNACVCMYSFGPCILIVRVYVVYASCQERCQFVCVSVCEKEFSRNDDCKMHEETLGSRSPFVSGIISQHD